jgi:hypothetical protein
LSCCLARLVAALSSKKFRTLTLSDVERPMIVLLGSGSIARGNLQFASRSIQLRLVVPLISRNDALSLVQTIQAFSWLPESRPSVPAVASSSPSTHSTAPRPSFAANPAVSASWWRCYMTARSFPPINNDENYGYPPGSTKVHR